MTLRNAMRATLTIWAALLAAMFALPVALAWAAEAPAQVRSIIILDSSAAMLNPLETFKKYYLVRKTFKDQSAALPAGIATGFIAFGHRRRAACDDVEQLRAIEPMDANKLWRSVFSVRPVGVAAVAQSLRAGAAALGPGGGKLLLIVGEADGCQEDTCAVARGLTTAEPGLSVDVLAVGASAADAAQLQCIADEGHGKVFAATTQANTPKAFADAFAALGVPAMAVKPPAAPAVIAPPPGSGPGFDLSASLAPDGPALAQPLSWTVRLINDGAPGAIAYHAVAPALAVPLAAGTYDIEAALGQVVVHQQAAASGNDHIALRLVLNAGTLRLHASAAKPDQPASEAVYRIYAASNDPENEAPEATIALLHDGALSPLLLPAALYRIIAERGQMRLEHTVQLGAGEDKTADFALATGILQIEAEVAADLKPGEAAKSAAVAYFVSEDDPDQPLGRRDVALSAIANPSFELPPGLYHVSTKPGASRARLDAVVRAGETTKLTVPAIMGRLRLETQGLPDGDALPDGMISYSVERLDEAGHPLGVAARTSQPTAILALEAGQYRVTGRVGLGNIAATADIAVKAGGEARAVVHQEAGILSLRLGEAAAMGPGLLWEIRDSAGKVIWSTTAAEPAAPLAPGTYSVRVLRLNKEQTASVTLLAGERKSVVIAPE